MTLADELVRQRAALTMIHGQPFNAEAPPEALETEGLVAALGKQAEAIRARHGIAVRRHVSASRWRVKSFSAASSSRRAFSHSSRETT